MSVWNISESLHSIILPPKIILFTTELWSSRHAVGRCVARCRAWQGWDASLLPPKMQQSDAWKWHWNHMDGLRPKQLTMLDLLLFTAGVVEALRLKHLSECHEAPLVLQRNHSGVFKISWNRKLRSYQTSYLCFNFSVHATTGGQSMLWHEMTSTEMVVCDLNINLYYKTVL